MERTTWRERTLDAFAVNLDVLDGLCSRLLAECGGYGSISIELKFPDETLKFYSVDEIRENYINHKTTTKFTISIYHEGKYVSLDSEALGLLPLATKIRSSSDNEAWCAGVNEAAVSYLRKHRVWYYWLTRKYVWWPAGLLLAGVLLTASRDTISILVGRPVQILLTGLMVGLLGMALSFGNRLLPAARINICPQQRDWKMIIAIATLAFTILGTLIALA